MVGTFCSSLVGGSQLTMGVRLSSHVLTEAETGPMKTIFKGSEKDGTCCGLSPGQCVTLHCVGFTGGT